MGLRLPLGAGALKKLPPLELSGFMGSRGYSTWS